MTHDPIRLLDDPSAHAALRRDLAVAARHRVPFDAAAGAARLEASLSKGAGAASSSWGGSALGVGALILGGLIAAGVWLTAPPAAEQPAADTIARGRASAPAIVEAPVVEVPVVEAPVVPAAPVVAAPVPAVAAVPEDMVEETDVPAAPSKPSARPKVRAQKQKKERPEVAPAAGSREGIAGGADYLREAKSLQSARGLLGRDPAQALARAQAGAAEFPGGAFAQEWEGVELLALFELGRRSEAESRAERYLERFPKGPYAAQIREALGRE